MADDTDPPDLEEETIDDLFGPEKVELIEFVSTSEPVTRIRRADLQDADLLLARALVTRASDDEQLVLRIAEALKTARAVARHATLSEVRAAVDFMGDRTK